MNQRIESLSYFSIIVMSIYTFAVLRYFMSNPYLGQYGDHAFVVLTSVGGYKLLLSGLHSLVCHVQPLLRLHWGDNYLHGLWSYSYKKREVPDKRFLGIWQVSQNLYSTKVSGFGLDDAFERRTRVESLTDIRSENQGLEIVFMRSDDQIADKFHYSRTKITILQSAKSYPVKFLAQTFIYGGQRDGEVHEDVFVKHESARSVDDVIAELKQAQVRLTEPNATTVVC